MQRAHSEINETCDTLSNSIMSPNVAPVCDESRLLGTGLMFLCLASIVVNSFLLRMFFCYNHLKTPMSAFVIAFTVLSLVGSLFEMPLIVTNVLVCK